MHLSHLYMDNLGSRPHEKFFNGDALKMIEAGTYAEYREYFVEKLAKGQLRQADLKSFDEIWAKKTKPVEVKIEVPVEITTVETVIRTKPQKKLGRPKKKK